jgi:hypothetical protein
MERRIGLRARTDFGVMARDGTRRSRCRGIEVSSTGIILDRGRPIGRGESSFLMGLEIRLPERVQPLRALARPVWSFGTQQALRFVRMSDADRLTLAEHLDVLRLRGVALC